MPEQAFQIPPDVIWQVLVGLIVGAIISAIVLVRERMTRFVVSLYLISRKKDPLSHHLGTYQLIRTEAGAVFRPSVRIYRNWMLAAKAEFILPDVLGNRVSGRGPVEIHGDQIWIEFRGLQNNESRLRRFWLCLRTGESRTGSDIRTALILGTKFDLNNSYVARFVATRSREITDAQALQLLTRNSTLIADTQFGSNLQKKLDKILIEPS